MCEVLTFLLDNIYIRFGSKLYRKIEGIPIGTTCVPLVANLIWFCMRETSCCLFHQSEVIEAFSSTSWYQDDLLKIDNHFFDSMINHKDQRLRNRGIIFGFTFIYIG